MPPEVKEVRALTAEQFVKDFNDLLYMDMEQLKAVTKDPKTPALRSYMANCLYLGKVRGDYWALDKMLDRIVGKVREPANPDQENVLKDLLAAMVGAAQAAQPPGAKPK